MYKLEHDTWIEFEETVEGRKLFLYGDAKAGKEFIHNTEYEVTGVITNGFEKMGEEFEGVPLWSIEELSNMEPQELVVLITSERFDEKIKELGEYGFSNYFVKSFLDANEKIFD
ncbi:hypothetical protein [Anaerosacchariphilus polymeriproducens]|uniref:Uncharacterized protein n=1 Tax=Anaerosacchariphilus polymeriproducens TaxID=1812858 RepID=A0A371AQM1_9FIRM|nr:hypothetical protein [Anaerosacchariphilus polymeriproducens]RDU21867.1 hypothetical protein DWV06_17960 [Anaerosacchariphilus polymeriproducens]